MAGTPTLIARDYNNNVVLTLGPTPNANGDYIELGPTDWVAENGVTVLANFYLRVLLTAATNASFAGQTLRYNITFQPASGGWAANGAQQPLDILSGELRFKRAPAMPQVYAV